jgi:hypothetical protein
LSRLKVPLAPLKRHLARPMPSTALVTVTTGVRTPSAIMRAAAATATSWKKRQTTGRFRNRPDSLMFSSSAKVPPSP